MNRDTVLKFIGAALMFGAGYAGSQNREWGWILAGVVFVFILLTIWLKNRDQ